MPMSAIEHKCKEMWNINVNAIYYDTLTMQNYSWIGGNDCNNDAVLNKEECNAMISYLSTI